MKTRNMPSVVELCQALVRIPSENPSGSSASHGEKQIAQFVGEFLSQLGAKVEYQDIAANRPNVYGIFPQPTDASMTVLFAPHLDTVPVRGMTVDPFAATLRCGRIIGRGTSDTKGSVAAMLWAIGSVDLERLNVAVVFAGLADEEAGQLGAQACAKQQMADFVIVGEPTGLDVVYTHKGTAWLKLTTRGKSAHASAPDTGVNAIERLFEAYGALKAKFPELCPVSLNPALGHPTISLGVIEGGTKINVVPDLCSAEIDVRTVPGQENMVEAIADFLRTAQIPAAVEPLKVSRPLHVEPTLPEIARLNGIGARIIGASWFCDAAVFAQYGTPAVAVGPGSISQAHTADEYILVEDLKRGAEFFRKYLLSFAP
jgi:acetylornithine deacetylase/succinyl-diaminopimelate desuccinylase-like protein